MYTVQYNSAVHGGSFTVVQIIKYLLLKMRYKLCNMSPLLFFPHIQLMQMNPSFLIFVNSNELFSIIHITLLTRNTSLFIGKNVNFLPYSLN